MSSGPGSTTRYIAAPSGPSPVGPPSLPFNHEEPGGQNRLKMARARLLARVNAPDSLPQSSFAPEVGRCFRLATENVIIDLASIYSMRYNKSFIFSIIWYLSIYDELYQDLSLDLDLTSRHLSPPAATANSCDRYVARVAPADTISRY